MVSCFGVVVYSSGLDHIVSKIPSVSTCFEVVVFKGVAYKQIFFINKISIILGHTALRCALK